MAIEKMQHVVVLAPSAIRPAVVGWLYGRREMHVMPFDLTAGAGAQHFAALWEDASRAETEATRLQAISSFLREHSPDRPDFLSSVFPVRTLATEEDISRAVESLDSESLYDDCRELRDEIEASAARRSALLAEAERLREFSFLSVEIGRLRSLERTAVRFLVGGKSSARFLDDGRVAEHLAAAPAARCVSGTLYVVAARKGDAGLIEEVAHDYGLHELALPETDSSAAERLAAIESQLEDITRRASQLAERASDLSSNLTAAELALAYWESERSRIAEQGRMVHSGHVFAARGYVRRDRIERLRDELEVSCPGAGMIETGAPGGEEPPVSLCWSRFVRPVGLLVRMFGLPKYDTFDPTPFIMTTFLVFFGICFGDVLYGAMLIGVAALLKRKFAGQRHLAEFFRLFSYAGVTTIIFGVLTGSWGGDLTAYLGEGNSLDALRRKLTLIDPLQDPILGLGIAIGLGVLHQFYGLALKFASLALRGDYFGGFCDGILWMLYLGSLMTLFVGLVGAAGSGVTAPSLAVFAISAAGLVLTQGRREKGFAAKAATGVVSLYGILGSYGTTSFIGDIVSYSRLLALGMTTSVIAMAFNIIAGFLKQIPAAGIVLFIAVATFGHLFNFTMSILGSFVHPARLIFLEFFGRFYEGGGSPFRPFGFDSAGVELVRDAGAASAPSEA